jgi:hypothetical protein
MDGKALTPEPTPTTSVDCRDAYEAFWQSLDVDNSKSTDAPDSAHRNAYEQFWNLVDAD